MLKRASTSSNIDSTIAGNCVADPSTLSKLPASVQKLRKIQASTSSNIADNVEHDQLSSNIARNFQLFDGSIDYNLAKGEMKY